MGVHWCRESTVCKCLQEISKRHFYTGVISVAGTMAWRPCVPAQQCPILRATTGLHSSRFLSFVHFSACKRLTCRLIAELLASIGLKTPATGIRHLLVSAIDFYCQVRIHVIAVMHHQPVAHSRQHFLRSFHFLVVSSSFATSPHSFRKGDLSPTFSLP